jgi:hypothetical protein
VPDSVPASDGDLDAPAALDGPVAAGAEIDVAGSGYLPESTVTVVVYSEPTVLGSAAVDASGAFSASVTLPEDLPAGAHTLVASGVDPQGNPRYLTLPITVAGATGAVHGRLAFTGFDVQAPLTGGLAALGIGTALIVVSRRRRAGA